MKNQRSFSIVSIYRIGTYWSVGTFILTIPSVRRIFQISKELSNSHCIHPINAIFIKKPLELVDYVLVEGNGSQRFVFDIAG
ncbi:MAG: hypothetical protein J7L19_02320 [Dehalococcoidia bacterium]|nr:hypothetical protein [Dehalococcoidia bacterium]